jgi:hypothetical protein
MPAAAAMNREGRQTKVRIVEDGAGEWNFAESHDHLLTRVAL